MVRIVDGRIRAENILPAAVREPALDTLSVTGPKVRDDAITAPKIDTLAVITEHIRPGNVTNPTLNSLFQMQRLVAIGSVEAYVSFPTAYGDTPVVTTAPGPTVTYARVTAVTPGSFAWLANAPGSASWMAWGHR